VIAIVCEGFHRLQTKHIPLFAAVGFTGMYGNQLLFILGLYYTTPNNAAIFQVQSTPTT
jgi:drug/metabolite transporter (DMT)-like permease